MATEGLPARPGAFAQLLRGLMLADARRPAEDTTGSVLRAWWRVAIHPTPATLRAWGRRAGLPWIILSLVLGMVLTSVSVALDTFHVSDVTELNAQAQYLAHPSIEQVIVPIILRAGPTLPLTLTVLFAVALVTRHRRPGGLRARWNAILPQWALVHPVVGSVFAVTSAGALGMATVLQWMHATPPTSTGNLLLGLLSLTAALVTSFVMVLLAAMFLGYIFILFYSAILAVVPIARRSLGWLVIGVFFVAGLALGILFNLAVHAIGLPGTLFG